MSHFIDSHFYLFLSLPYIFHVIRILFCFFFCFFCPVGDDDYCFLCFLIGREHVGLGTILVMSEAPKTSLQIYLFNSKDSAYDLLYTHIFFSFSMTGRL